MSFTIPSLMACFLAFIILADTPDTGKKSELNSLIPQSPFSS